MYRISFIPKKGNFLTRKQTTLLGTLFESLIPAINKLKTAPKGSVAEVDQLVAITDGIVSGTGLRTICAPDDGLKAAQKKVADQLQRFRPHPSCHGFARGRDALGCARAHVAYWGKTEKGLVVLNMDAKDFFHSISGTLVRTALKAHHIEDENIEKILKLATLKPDRNLAACVIGGMKSFASDLATRHDQLKSGKAREVEEALDTLFKLTQRKTKDGGVLATRVCRSMLSLGPRIHAGEVFTPQGAPTSPVLSNLCMKIVDIRLSAMAKQGFGGYYTRYADDLTVSWLVPTKGKTIDGMYRCATEVLLEYGVLMNRKKKRVMGTGSRQDVVGYCINSGRPTISQKRYRKPIRREVRDAIRNGKVENLNLLRIRGQLAFVTTAHGGEAKNLWHRIEGAIHSKGPRDISSGIEEHDITIDLTQGGGSIDLGDGLEE